jgi:hypothetical protein
VQNYSLPLFNPDPFKLQIPSADTGNHQDSGISCWIPCQESSGFRNQLLDSLSGIIKIQESVAGFPVRNHPQAAARAES